MREQGRRDEVPGGGGWLMAGNGGGGGCNDDGNDSGDKRKGIRALINDGESRCKLM